MTLCWPTAELNFSAPLWNRSDKCATILKIHFTSDIIKCNSPVYRSLVPLWCHHLVPGFLSNDSAFFLTMFVTLFRMQRINPEHEPFVKKAWSSSDLVNSEGPGPTLSWRENNTSVKILIEPFTAKQVWQLLPLVWPKREMLSSYALVDILIPQTWSQSTEYTV